MNILLTLILILPILTGCSLFKDNSQIENTPPTPGIEVHKDDKTPSESTISEEVVDYMKRYENLDGMFSLSLPEHWLSVDGTGKYENPHYPITELSSGGFGDPDGTYEISLDVYYEGNGNRREKTWHEFAQEQALFSRDDTLIREEQLSEWTIYEYKSEPRHDSISPMRYKVLFITDTMVVGLQFPKKDDIAKRVVSSFMLMNSEEVEKKKAAQVAAVEEKEANPDILTILAFYEHIENHEFKEAYDLYSVKKVGIGTFQGWYEKVETIKTWGIHEDEPSLFTFTIDMEESDGNSSHYRVAMYSKDGKIETKSSQRISNRKKKCDGETCIVLFTNENQYNITLEVHGAKAPVIVKTGNSQGVTISNMHFSWTKRYLLFNESWTGGGIDFTNHYVYSVSKEERPETKELIIVGNASTMSLLPDDTGIVACGLHAGSAVGYVEIYKLPSGEKLAWESVESGDPNCEIDLTTMTVNWFDAEKNQEKILNIRTGAPI